MRYAQNLYIWGFLLQGSQRTALSHPKNANQLYLRGPMRKNDCFFLGPFALKTKEMTLYLLHNLMQRYIGSLLVMACLCLVITRKSSDWCVYPEKYTVTDSKRVDQGGKSSRLTSGYMRQQIPLRLERRQWCCHVSCISTMYNNKSGKESISNNQAIGVKKMTVQVCVW